MFWVISLLGLLWNVLGCFNFIMQRDPGAVADLPLAYQLVIAGRPGWVTAAFFIAVFGGALGCVLMLLRRATARPALFLSLIGVLLTTGHALWLGACGHRRSVCGNFKWHVRGSGGRFGLVHAPQAGA
jgi:hypothetical protein